MLIFLDSYFFFCILFGMILGVWEEGNLLRMMGIGGIYGLRGGF